jgi:hypothetical protein
MLGDDDWLGDCRCGNVEESNKEAAEVKHGKEKTAFKNMKAEMNKRLKIAQAKQSPKKYATRTSEAHCLSLSVLN